ncbi:hypothetical protein JAAARDRAFT_59641 [Jaapia argillacea MUCL 33604]|uniref:Uncharacterized protein n=1 Tax=Jaapia argillacea MUCL 33604 TaxID=933084 RepID=A0A067PPB6_9AGAM|nr:hypothetical protein JAAARDRAFT_59641 [Jaapia argillacea MUCL 33604]
MSLQTSTHFSPDSSTPSTESPSSRSRSGKSLTFRSTNQSVTTVMANRTHESEYEQVQMKQGHNEATMVKVSDVTSTTGSNSSPLLSHHSKLKSNSPRSFPPSCVHTSTSAVNSTPSLPHTPPRRSSRPGTPSSNSLYKTQRVQSLLFASHSNNHSTASLNSTLTLGGAILSTPIRTTAPSHSQSPSPRPASPSSSFRRRTHTRAHSSGAIVVPPAILHSPSHRARATLAMSVQIYSPPRPHPQPHHPSHALPSPPTSRSRAGSASSVDSRGRSTSPVARPSSRSERLLRDTLRRAEEHDRLVALSLLPVIPRPKGARRGSFRSVGSGSEEGCEFDCCEEAEGNGQQAAYMRGSNLFRTISTPNGPPLVASSSNTRKHGRSGSYSSSSTAQQGTHQENPALVYGTPTSPSRHPLTRSANSEPAVPRPSATSRPSNRDQESSSSSGTSSPSLSTIMGGSMSMTPHEAVLRSRLEGVLRGAGAVEARGRRSSSVARSQGESGASVQRNNSGSSGSSREVREREGMVQGEHGEWFWESGELAFSPPTSLYQPHPQPHPNTRSNTQSSYNTNTPSPDSSASQTPPSPLTPPPTPPALPFSHAQTSLEGSPRKASSPRLPSSPRQPPQTLSSPRSPQKQLPASPRQASYTLPPPSSYHPHIHHHQRSASFNAQTASQLCRQMDGYVSFRNVEGLGVPPEEDLEEGEGRERRGLGRVWGWFGEAR